MAVLEAEKYNEVVIKGKEAVQALKNGNTLSFFQLAEEAWNKFPDPKENWNQGYNFSKMIFKHSIDNNNLEEAQKWLNRMIENNENLHLFDFDIDFNVGKLHFEKSDYDKARDRWNYVVAEAGFRYFESEDSKYRDFYQNPEKYS